MGESFCPIFYLASLTKCWLLISFCSPCPPRVALETLDRLTESLDFTDYASRIIHPIVRTLDSTPELRSTSMDTLSSLVFQLGKKVAAVWGPVLRAWRGGGGFPVVGAIIQKTSPAGLPTVGCSRAGFFSTHQPPPPPSLSKS